MVTKPKRLVSKEKMLVALATLSLAISSPGHVIKLLQWGFTVPAKRQDINIPQTSQGWGENKNWGKWDFNLICWMLLIFLWLRSKRKTTAITCLSCQLQRLISYVARHAIKYVAVIEKVNYLKELCLFLPMYINTQLAQFRLWTVHSS